MRGALAIVSDDGIEHTCASPYTWELEISPTDSYACLVYNGHRLLTTNPEVVAFLRNADTTVRYAHYQSTDDIPTDADLAYAILAGQGNCPQVDLPLDMP